jgi:hypothetical protein
MIPPDERAAVPHPFLVLNGMHGSGKTTAQIYLSDLGYLTHAEIGWAYRQHLAHHYDRDRTLLGDDLAWYDRKIFAMERARDRFLEGFTALPHCVETWHLGNLAYASQRSPAILDDLEAIFLEQTERMQPLFLFLAIGRDTFIERCTLDDTDPETLYDFYARMRDTMLDTLRRYGFPHHVINNEGSLEDLRQALARIVSA